MPSLAMRNREKRCDGLVHLIKEDEIQNFCSNARYPLENIKFKYDFHLFEFIL
jgi:hypothetical protein